MAERLNSDRISIYSLNKFLKWQFLTVIFNIGIPPCIFLTKVCGNRALGRSISAIFPTAFAHSVSLSHFGNSRNISNPLPAKILQLVEGLGDG